MKIYIVTTDDSEELLFSTLRKARRYGEDIRIKYMDADSLPHEGCTWADLEWWSDAIDTWLID